MRSDGIAVGIRDATDADLPALLEILNREIRESPYVFLDTPFDLGDRQRWLDEHRAANLPVIVASTDSSPDDIAGWGSLSPYRASGGYRYTIEASVYVAPTAQRRGVGRRLLTTLIDAAVARGSHAIVASIDSENAASVALFERAGFREAARLSEVGWKFGTWRTQLLLLRQLESAQTS